MRKTNLKFGEKDLREEIAVWNVAETTKIRHRFTLKENKVVNTITINGKTYAYGNLVGEFYNEIEQKRLLKRYAKLSLYKALSLFLSKELPWGALTGIRPTKLAYQQLEKGEDFRSFFLYTMRVSEPKIRLTEKVLKSQQGIYRKDENDTDLFVFIPFCPSRCKYCSFISADVKSASLHINEYVDALCKEIEKSAKFIKNLRSIYVGGGTPVALENDQLEKILKVIDKINTGVEFTVEAGRPDRITKENLALLKKYRVNRICVNPQTFNDKTLELIGRRHTSQDVIQKYLLAKEDFIVNMDLIAGLPGESAQDFKNSLDKAIALSPDNITVHTLCIKRGSFFAQNSQIIDDNGVIEMIDYAQEKLTQNGYNPYYLYRQKYMTGNLENVGYAKKGAECIYNVDIMEETTSIVACGAGAISKKVNFNSDVIKRVPAPKDVITYISKVDKLIEDKEQLFFD